MDGAAGDRFGSSMALDGDTLIIGAPAANVGANSDQGAAYVFVRSSGVWTEQAKLTAPGGAANDQFGSSVAISADTVIVGAPDKHGGTCIVVPFPVACAGAGAAYVFTRTAGGWSAQAELGNPQPSGAFGRSVAIDGDTVLVGRSWVCWDGIAAPTFRGSVSVYVRSGGVWMPQGFPLGSDSSLRIRFGTSVALDGDTAVVGAPSHRSTGAPGDVGSAYVFQRSGGSWTEQANWGRRVRFRSTTSA